MNKLALAVSFTISALLPAPAFACLPSPAGIPEPELPSVEEQARVLYDWASDILYGEVVTFKGELRFKIIQTLKGQGRPGSVIQAEVSHGFPSPLCPGMTPPLAPPKGLSGIIVFRDNPRLAFLGQELLSAMVTEGLVQQPDTAAL